MREPFTFLYQEKLEDLNTYLEHENVNVVDEHHASLLHHAIKLKYKEAFELLLQHFIDTEIADDNGDTCFHYAVHYSCLSFLRILFIKGGNPMIRNKRGQTPLYLACRYGKEDIIDLYLEKYFLDMGEKDNENQTICMALTYSRNPRLFEKYKNYTPWIDEENYSGDTPFLLAVKIDSLVMAEFFLSKGAFINHLNHAKESALFYAVRNENKQMIALLFKHGIFLDFKNIFYETIYSIAKKPILDYILEHKAYEPYSSYTQKFPLHSAIYLNDAEKIQQNLTLRYVFLEDSFGVTPYMLAKSYNNMDLLKSIKEFERLAKIATFQTKL